MGCDTRFLVCLVPGLAGHFLGGFENANIEAGRGHFIFFVWEDTTMLFREPQSRQRQHTFGH